jgi:hypothetical protein
MPPPPTPWDWMHGFIYRVKELNDDVKNARRVFDWRFGQYLEAVHRLTKRQLQGESAPATLSAQQDEMLRVLQLQKHKVDPIQSFDALYSILCEMRQTRELIDSFDADIATLETRGEEARAQLIVAQQRLDDLQLQLMEAERVLQWAQHRAQLRGGRRYSRKAEKAEKAERYAIEQS